ncbi:MAG: amidohydrolase family protein [Candidatus Rariloculaceae bacterium]
MQHFELPLTSLTILAFWLLTSISVAPVNAQECSVPRDLALVNGKIYQMNAANSIASSVLIKNSRIANVDPDLDEDDVCTDIIDLQGRVVIPGLIDNHIHYIRIANRPGYDTRTLETTFTLSEALAAIEARTASVPAGELISTIGGIRQTQWAEGRFPNRNELDDAAPNHAVYLSERGTGPGQTNTAGRNLLRELGIIVADDGSIERGPETAKAYAVLAASLTNEDRKRQMLDVASYSLSVGMTTVMDMSGTVPGVGFIDQTNGYDFLLEMVRENTHKVRTRIYFPGLDEDANLTQLMGYLNNKWPNYGPEMARIVGIGEWSVGRSLFNEQPLGNAARLAQRKIAERGWTYHQHMHSPAEIDAHFDVWEDLSTQFNIAEMRWTPGHLSGITTELIDRSINMGLGLGLHGQPYHSSAASGGPPWRTAINSGAVAVGAGSDGARINTLNPWCIIYYMVTGKNVSGELTNADETISRYNAVRLYSSVEQGWFTKEDDTLGGIDIGRFADLAVLSADVFDPTVVSDEEIRKMTSVLTIVAGEIVHDAGIL